MIPLILSLMFHLNFEKYSVLNAISYSTPKCINWKTHISSFILPEAVRDNNGDFMLILSS